MYQITKEQRKLASELGLTIYPSQSKYKLDVYKNGKYLTSIGDINYNDYFIYLRTQGKAIAQKHRYFYFIRHKKDLLKPRGFLSGRLLWSI
jgi:hypothetical protein